jgi:hypothetical protein
VLMKKGIELLVGTPTRDGTAGASRLPPCSLFDPLQMSPRSYNARMIPRSMDSLDIGHRWARCLRPLSPTISFLDLQFFRSR